MDEEIVNSIMGRLLGLCGLLVEKGVATEQECMKAILDGEKKMMDHLKGMEPPK